MKTILFLENGVSAGGSFESLFLLATRLDKTKFRPLAVFVNKTALVERLKGQGIAVEVIHDALYSAGQHSPGEWLFVRVLLFLQRLFPRFTIRWENILHYHTISTLRRLVKIHQVDLVHLNNQSLRDLYGVIAAARMKIPCLSYLRSARVTAVPYAVSRFLNKNIAQFVANSHFAKQYWAGLGIDPAKIKVVYNAVENAPAVPLDARKEWNINPSIKYAAGCVGNLSEGKGQDFLLRAFKQVLEQEPQTVLLMVGEGPRRAGLAQLAAQLGISQAVIFAGYDARARKIIAALDLLILPSQTETFGRVLLEAMAAGTPIVATRAGGIPEVVEDGVNGILVDFGDEDGFASAMCKMLTDKALRRRFVEEGLRRVQTKFDLDKHISALEQIYDSL